MRSRHALVVLALGGQFVALSAGWFVTFRVVQRQFATVIQEQVIDQNREFGQTLATLFEDQLEASASARMRSVSDLHDVEFGSEEWEELQRLIENDALAMLPAGGFACLIEEDGQLLCHPDIRDRPGLRDFSFGDYDLRATLGSEDRRAIVDVGMDGEVASGVTDFGAGDFHYLATTEIGESGLRLLIHQPVDEVVKVGEASTAFIAVVAGVMAAVMLGITGGGLTFLLRRYDGVHEALNRQLHANLEAARRIQQSTLPAAWPAPAGWEIAAWSEPADETGGDSFDVVGLVASAEGEPGGGFGLSASESSRGVALLLADATGHGIGPALAVTQLQSIVRVAWRTRGSLIGVARLVSERLEGALPEGRFITAWMGRLDTEAGVLESYSAGQGPLFRVTASGEVEASAADGLPLGLTGELGAAGARRVALEPGDVFVVLSDGLIEAANGAGEQFGSERMGELLAAKRGESAEAIAAAMRSAVEAFSPGAADDDRTVVVVKRVG